MFDRLTLLVPPTVMPVTLEEARKHARVDGDDEDDLIELLIGMAASLIDGPDGIGYAMEAQTWKLTLDRFPSVIKLPMRPVVSVSSITYVGNDGSTITLAAESYRVIITGGLAQIEPVEGLAWPSTKNVTGAVNVTFVAGTGTPKPLKVAVLMMVSDAFDNREAQSKVEIKQNKAVSDILDRYRVGWAVA